MSYNAVHYVGSTEQVMTNPNVAAEAAQQKRVTVAAAESPEFTQMDGFSKTSVKPGSEAVLDFRGNDGSLVSALKTLLFFTILMVTVPIGLYFVSKSYIFEGSMQMSNTDSYFYAAIVAVLAVHVVLALFVYVAWNDGSSQRMKGKHD